MRGAGRIFLFSCREAFKPVQVPVLVRPGEVPPVPVPVVRVRGLPTFFSILLFRRLERPVPGLIKILSYTYKTGVP